MSPSVQVAKGSVVASLGEGPHWDAKKEELLYVDILGQSVLRYIPKTQECFKVAIETGTVSFVIPVEGVSNQYLLGVGRTITLMEWDGTSQKPTSLQILCTVDEEEKCIQNRLNDAKCDSKGRLWAGTMGCINQSTLELSRNNGNLYSFFGGKPSHHLGKIDISNGLCWSPDNRVMYYIDSFKYRVDAFDYDVNTGTMSNRREIFDLKGNEKVQGFPDGMTIDANGNLWIAVFDGGKIIHVDPNAKTKIGEVIIPTGKVTSVAFGGSQLETLYATTCCKFTEDGKVDPELGAGELYEITNLGVKGLGPGQSFNGNSANLLTL